jgi:hypothetical protein
MRNNNYSYLVAEHFEATLWRPHNEAAIIVTLFAGGQRLIGCEVWPDSDSIDLLGTFMRMRGMPDNLRMQVLSELDQLAALPMVYPEPETVSGWPFTREAAVICVVACLVAVVLLLVG